MHFRKACQDCGRTYDPIDDLPLHLRKYGRCPTHAHEADNERIAMKNERNQKLGRTGAVSKEMRRQVHQQGACQRCGRTDGQLEAHLPGGGVHRLGDRYTALCPSCHRIVEREEQDNERT